MVSLLIFFLSFFVWFCFVNVGKTLFCVRGMRIAHTKSLERESRQREMGSVIRTTARFSKFCSR